MRPRAAILLLFFLLFAAITVSGTHARKKTAGDKKPAEDPYAGYVWPPPPDEARIRLTAVIRSRSDVEARTGLMRRLLGASPGSVYDELRKPFDVAFDDQGRILVTDTAHAALIRFDRAGGRMDVFGTQGALRLKTPLGVSVATDGTIHVADAGLQRVVALGPDGEIRKVYGTQGDLENPTDAVLSPDGHRLLVSDSRAHAIVIFDRDTGERLLSFGKKGTGKGEFSAPTSITFDSEGNLYVVDQLNARVQILFEDGKYIDEIGGLGVGYGNLARPKDVAVDDNGLIYVTDFAFSNLQLFDADLSLLTFIGDAGLEPGQFRGASGVAARDGEFAVVDQLGRRVQIFRFIDAAGVQGDEDGPATVSRR